MRLCGLCPPCIWNLGKFPICLSPKYTLALAMFQEWHNLASARKRRRNSNKTILQIKGFGLKGCLLGVFGGGGGGFFSPLAEKIPMNNEQ